VLWLVWSYEMNMKLGSMAVAAGIIAVAAAAAVAACDPSTHSTPPPRSVGLNEIEAQIAEVVCDLQFECVCPEDTFYQSAAQCRETTATLAESIRLTAMQNNLTWDRSCLGAVLDIIDAAGCDPSLGQDGGQECTPPCNYLYGMQTVGSPCRYIGSNSSDCAQGLQCQGRSCVDPCVGDDGTEAGEGQSCADTGICAEGLFCDWNVALCAAIPHAGQPCPSGACVEGSFCEFEDPNDPMTPLVCKVPYANGEPCRGHNQCDTGYCPAGLCDLLPNEGESCRGTNACAKDLDCIEEVCQPGAPAVCWMTVPLPGL
jgi:hypothetical protein